MTIHVEGMRQRLSRVLEGELEIGDVLGVGGFAAVFRAHDRFLDRDVAVKVLDPELSLSTDREAEFLNEARIVAGVEHPHIVPLYKAEARDGLLYLVMRLLPGKSLADRITKEGPLPFADAARLAHEVAQALATAHARGVVHRDIKPDNILLDASGHAVITDFGIARITAQPGRDAQGLITGTPRYMPPEQLLGEAVDGKADVYALGVMLFEMLTGHVPIDERSVQALIARHMREAPPKVGDVRKDTPTALVTALDLALKKSVATRPTSAEIAKMLADARTPDALMTPAMARRKRLKRRLAILGVVVATASIVLYGVARALITWLGMMSGGEVPVLSALGAAIPDSLVEAARREGAVGPLERVVYAFVPHGLSFGDALLMTDSAIVRRSPSGFRRLPNRTTDLLIERKTNKQWSGPRGFLLAKPRRAATDTLYRALSGAESMKLLTDLMAVNKALNVARDSARNSGRGKTGK